MQRSIPMKLLITGGAGYIGSHTVREALAAGHSVVVLDNLCTGHRESLPEGVDFFQGDLRKKEDILGVFEKFPIDGVLHFAAFCSVGESVEWPDRYYENNLLSSLNLIQGMTSAGVKKIIFSSTCAVYGNPDVREISEELPRNPVNPYGRSKAFFEQVMEDYRKSFDLEFMALRYFNAAGAHPQGILGEDHDPETHLIPRILDAALGKIEKVLIFGADYPTPDGTCVRDYVHVSDLARAHILALEKLDTLAGEFINLGTGCGNSVLEVVEAAKKITGVDFPVEMTSRRPGDPAYLEASGGKARSLLGWEPQYTDISTIVETAWNWHKGERWGGGREL